MDWENERILRSFYEVIQDTRTLNMYELEKKHSEFKEAHEKLFNVAIDSVATNKVQESISKLKGMLADRESVKKGMMTQSVANLKIGNQLGHEYIYPKVGKVPSKEDYKRAIDEIRKKETE
jgi:recombinational DNA repair protein RecT